MKKIKQKKCANPGCENKFTPFKSTDKYCSFSCTKACTQTKRKHYKIPKKSKKQASKDRQYLKLRKEFLSRPENQICFVEGCNRKATTVEHTKGRIGSNYLNVDTWRPCCLFHNLEFERNPELSNKYQESRFHEGKKIKK